MQSDENRPHPLAPHKRVNINARTPEPRGAPHLHKVFLEDKPSIELSHHQHLKTPLLHSSKGSHDETSHGEKRPSHQSSYNDIEELMTPETKKIHTEMESINEKTNPIRMIPLPVNRHNPHWFRIEVLFRFALPIFVFSLSQMITETITLIFAGNFIGYQAVAAIGLGNMFYNSTGMIIIAGINSSLNAITSHEYSTRNYRQAGLIYHKSLIISLFFAVLFCVINFYSAEFLSYIGIAPEICANVNSYMLGLSISIIPFAITTCTMSFLEAHHIQRPQNFAAVITPCSHLFMTFLFVKVFDWGLFGAGLAFTISSICDAVVLIYVMNKNAPRSLFWFDVDSVKGMKPFVGIAMQSCVMLFVEWWGLEIITLFVAYVGVKELAAHTVMYHVECMMFLFMNAISSANFTMLGSFIAENNKDEFNGYKEAVMTAGTMAGLGLIALVMVLKGEISVLFVQDLEAQQIIASSMGFVVLLFIFDSMETILEPILKSIGRYNSNLILTIVGYYLVGIPAILILGFAMGYGMYGAWLGTSIGLALISIVYLVQMRTTNFGEEVDRYNCEVLSEVKKTLDLSLNPRGMDAMNGMEMMEIYIDRKVKDNTFLMSPHNPVINDFVAKNR